MNFTNRMGLSRAWLTALACALLYGFVIGLGSNCKGLFFSVMADSLGVSLGAVTRYLTFYGVSSAVCIPLFTRFFLRTPARVSLSVGVLLYAVSVYFQGDVQSTAALYVLGVIRGIPGGFIVTYPMQYIIGSWFPDKKGTVLGMTVTAAGIVGTVFNPVVQHWIEAYGWRSASRITGLLLFVVGTAAALLLEKSPEKQQNQPQGDKAAPAEPENTREGGEKMPLGMLCCLALFMLAIDLLIMLPQVLPSFAVSIDKTSDFGAVLVSAAMLGNIFFKLLLGFLNDRIGTDRTTLLALLPMAAAGAIMALTRMNALLLGAAFLTGTVSAIYAIQFPMMLRRRCPAWQYPKLYSYLCSMNSLVGSVSATVLSAFYTASGSFSPAMWFCVGIMVLCGVLCLFPMRGSTALPAPVTCRIPARH